MNKSGIEWCDHTSVSYTHLDVYKRQMEDFTSRE